MIKLLLNRYGAGKFHILLLAVSLVCCRCGIMVRNFVGESPKQAYELKKHTKRELYLAIKCLYAQSPGYYPALNMDSLYHIKRFRIQDPPAKRQTVDTDSLRFNFEVKGGPARVVYCAYINDSTKNWTLIKDYPRTSLVLDAVWENDRIYFISKTYKINGSKAEIKRVNRYVKEFRRNIVGQIRKNAEMAACQ